MSIADASWQDATPTLVSADESYLNDLQLQYDPFLIPPGLLYLPPRWEQHLDLLQHLSQNNNLLLAIIGRAGMGKTMFLEQFIAEAIANPITAETDISHKTLNKSYHLLSDDQQHICQISGDDALEPQSLIDLIVEGFNLTRQPVESLQEHCEVIIEVLHQRPQRSTLIIDDAHLLPIGTLQAILYLLNLQSDTKNQLQILLAGTENLRHNFHYLTEQHASTDIVCILDLEPFTLTETAQYLNHCLQQAGFSGESIFDDDEIEQIYNQSEGVPLQINHFAKQLLVATEQPIGEQKMNESMKEFIEQHRTKLIGGGVLLLFVAALMWSLLSSNSNKNDSSELVIDQSKVPQVSVAETVAQQQQLAHPDQNPPLANPAPATVVPGNDQQSNANTAKINNPVAADATGVVMDDESMAPAAAPTGATATASAQPATNAVTTAAVPSVKSQPTAIKLAPVSVNAPETKSTTAAVTKKSSANKAMSKTARTGYTLQLIGLSDKKRLESFVHTNHLQGKIDYVHTQKNGKDWYVVLYGHYTTAAQARQAIAVLPKGVQALNPWVRNMNTVATIQTAKSAHKASVKPAATTKVAANAKKTVAKTVKVAVVKNTVKVASATQQPKVTTASTKQPDNFMIDETIDG